jgi:hypothetical protein
MELDLSKFKPEFGNEKHINVCKLIGSLGEKTKQLAIKKKEARGIKKVESDIEEIKKQIIYLLK